MSESPRYGRNLTRFLQSITPTFSKAQIKRSSPVRNEPEFLLLDLWSYYDEPYGHECSLTFENGEIRDTYFVPYLSAVQLFTPSSSSSSESKKRALNNLETSTPTVKPIFQFFESAGPFLRVPVLDKIKVLAKFCPLLQNGRSSDLDLEKSWFSIFWYPILSDYNLTQPLSGSFLTYHSFEIVGRCPFRLSRSVSPFSGGSSSTVPLSQCPTGMTFTTSPCPVSEESAKESDESSVSSKGSPVARKLSSRSSTLSSRHSPSPKESQSPSTPTPTSSPSKSHSRKHKSSKNSSGSKKGVVRCCTVCHSEVCRSLRGGKKRTSSRSLRGLIFGGDRDRDPPGYYIALLGFVMHNVWDATWFPASESKHYDSPVTSRPVSPTSSTSTSSSLTPFFYSKGYASYKDISHDMIWNSVEKTKNPHPDFAFMTRQVPPS